MTSSSWNCSLALFCLKCSCNDHGANADKQMTTFPLLPTMFQSELKLTFPLCLEENSLPYQTG